MKNYRFNRYSLGALVLALALLLLSSASVSLAQGSPPAGPAQGSVQNGVYTWPQAGYSLTLPAEWIRNGYKWYELWGTAANDRMKGTTHINQWVYTPLAPVSQEAPLLTIYVYDKAAWDVMAASGGPLPSVVGEANGKVYTMTTPQANPYPSGSPDAQRFSAYSTSLSPAKSRMTITGAVTPPTSSSGVPTSKLSISSLENAVYTVPGVPNGRVQLQMGKYATSAAPGSASMIQVMLTEWVAFGELNGDTAEDAAGTLTSSGGGSGTFYNLVGVVNQGGQPVNVDTVQLGDRIKMKALAINKGQIVVTYLTRRPGEPFTAEPTVEVTRWFVLQNNKLVEF